MKTVKTGGQQKNSLKNCRTVEELGMLSKDNKGTWVKSCKESSERETEVVVLAEETAAKGKSDEHTRAVIRRSLRKLRKVEEEAAKELLEAVQERKQQLEDEVWKKVGDRMFSWERELRISGTLNANNWQMVQSSTATSENLEHDFTEIVARVQELGWTDGERLSRCRVEKEKEGSSR